MSETRRILVRDLPNHIARAIRGAGIGDKKTVEVRTLDLYDREYYGNAGSQGVCIEWKGEGPCAMYGSWGGPNPFGKPSPVDKDDEGNRRNEAGHRVSCRPLLPGQPVFKGSVGNYCGGTLYCHPLDFDRLAPPPPVVRMCPKTWNALATIRTIKAAYRRSEFEREGLGEYGASNSYVQALIEQGFAKVNKAGSISLTMEGKNARPPSREETQAHLQAVSETLEDALY